MQFNQVEAACLYTVQQSFYFYGSHSPALTAPYFMKAFTTTIPFPDTYYMHSISKLLHITTVCVRKYSSR